MSKERKPERRKVKEKLYLSDTIRTEYGDEIPVRTIEELYVRAGRSPARLCKIEGLPFAIVKKYAEYFDWDRRKEEYEQQNFNTIINLREDSFKECLDLDQKEQLLRDLVRRDQLQEAMKHYRMYGHLFEVDIDGNILFNKRTGKPIPLKYESSKEEIQSRAALAASIDLNMKLLNDAKKNPPILAKPKETPQIEGDITDAEYEEIFGEKKDE